MAFFKLTKTFFFFFFTVNCLNLDLCELGKFPGISTIRLDCVHFQTLGKIEENVKCDHFPMVSN